MRILLVQCEMHRWVAARGWSYNVHLGWEDGFRANQVEFFTITTPWLFKAKEIIGRRTFDQVWINDLALASVRAAGDITEAQLAMLAALAPVRVGLLTESIYDYSEEEMTERPSLHQRQAEVQKCLPHLTHVITYDEADVAEIECRSGLPCIWAPSPVVGSLIDEEVPPPARNCAIFSGGIYGDRQAWLDHPALQTRLAQQHSPDEGTAYATLFDLLHNRRTRRLMQTAFAVPFYPAYINALRHIRKRSYRYWLQGLQSGLTVVNLPHFVKSYTPRVIEGMAAGRPVLSWEIPNRPRNKALFVDGQEILLFQTPDELAEQVQRLQAEPLLAEQITANARRRIRQFHTTEQRVQQILDWTQSGTVPTYQ